MPNIYTNTRPFFRSLTLGKWEWNTEQIRRNPVNEDGITHYLTQQMTRLNPKTQLALKIAACFGFVINAATLQSALLGLDINVRILDDIVEIGFLQKLSNQYQWAHDQVHSVSRPSVLMTLPYCNLMSHMPVKPKTTGCL